MTTTHPCMSVNITTELCVQDYSNECKTTVMSVNLVQITFNIKRDS